MKSKVLNGLTITDNGLVSEKTLLFIHGNNSSCRTFYKLLNQKQFTGIHSITLDVPGHGESNILTNSDSDFHLRNLVESTHKTIVDLGITNLIVVAHSMGSHLIMNHPENSKYLIGAFCYGYPPLSSLDDFYQALNETAPFSLLLKPELNSEEIKLLSENLVTGVENRLIVEEEIRRTNPKFREQYGLSISQGLLCNEVETLESFRNPIALLNIAQDKFIKSSYFDQLKIKNLWTGNPILFEEASHTAHLCSPDRLAVLLDQYVNSCSC
jgi:hypothetical protein